MARSRNYFVCTNCEGHWIAERPDARETDCPYCRGGGVTSHNDDVRFARNDDAPDGGAVAAA